MEWSIPVYSGLKANGIGSNWRLGMYELCREVNRREYPGAIYRTKFQWSGAPIKSDLTYEDLDGITVQGKAKANLKSIQGAIRSMCSRFTTTRGGDVQWTVETLEDAIGYDLSLDPESATESRFWQAQQAALDRLIYTRATRNCIGAYNYGGNGSKRFDQQPEGEEYASFQEAWDDRFYQFYPASEQLGILGTAWTGAVQLGGGDVTVNQLRNTLLSYSPLTNVLNGALVIKTKYRMLEFNNGTTSFQYTVGSANGSVPSEDVDAIPVIPFKTAYIETELDDFVSGDDVLMVPMDDPDDVPFSVDIGGRVKFLRAAAVSATTYYELT